ncbi:MAG: NAD(P)/FAD-dependent oxidoreductase [Chloroflexi bacterium]|nr:NAD(P)/FAD-dependent oxidoreductase [Chloroflexota bacterium]
MKVGIIGGGAAGLAAAYELTKGGHFAEVFEVAPFLGGQASTFDVGGGRLERGYHHLFVSDTDMTDLIHELGLGDSLAWLESKVGVYHSGKIWDFATPLDLLRFKPLSLVQRLRLGLITFVLQKTRNWQKFEGVTAQDWLTGNLGKDIYEAIWEPMLRGKFGDYYDQISMTWLWGKIYLRVASRGKALQKERLGYPMGSFGEVFDRLEEQICVQGGAVHISARVSRVAVEDQRATGLEVQLPGGAPEVRSYDAVVATTPSYIFTRLVPPLPEIYSSKLEGVEYLSAVLLILALDRPLTSKYWLNVADRSLPFVGVIEHTNMIDPALYGGNHIVYLTNYTSRDSELYSKSPEELVDQFIPHLQKLNPAFDRSWIRGYFHHKVDGAQPIIGTNYGRQIPDHRTPIKNLYLANTTQIYPEDRGTNYSVRMGRQVAGMLLEDLASKDGLQGST